MTGKNIKRLAAAGLATLAMSFGAARADDQPLVIAIDSLGTEVLSPLVGNAPELHFLGAINEPLVYRGRGLDTAMYPGLAKSWDISDDGRVYTFHLEDVKFQDGSAFTSDDVLFTFNAIGAKESRNPRRYVVDWIEKMEAVDAHTVRITLKQRQNAFLRQLSNFAPYFPMISKKHFETLGTDEANRQPMGTGPYKLVEHNMSQDIILEGVKDHWRKTPDFMKIDARFVPDELTRISMLKAGEADLIPISAPSIREVEAAGFKILKNPGAYFLQLALGGQVLESREGYDENSPWASKKDPERSRKVRQALCMAVNTQEIRDRLLYGTGRPAAVQQFLPGTSYDRPDRWKPYAYDPDEAKRLLAEAGYANGFDRPITMYIIPEISPENADVSEAIAMAWERIGLKVERRVIDSPVFRKGWYSRSKMQVMSAYVLASTPLLDPLDWYSLAADTKGSINQLFESDEMSSIVNAGLAATDEAGAAAQREKLGDMVYNGYMSCPIALTDAIFAVSDRVAGWQQNSANKYFHNLEYIEAAH